MTCKFARKVWDLVYDWFDSRRVQGDNVLEFFEKHWKHRIRGDERIWQLIWHVSVWSIWWMRNNKLFRDIVTTPVGCGLHKN